MTTDVQSLLVRIDASTEALRKELARAEKSTTDFENKTGGALKRIDRQFDSFNKSARLVSGGLAAIGAGLSLRELGRYADQWREVNNRLTVATGSTAEAARVTDKLMAISQASRTSLSDNASLYAKLATAGRELGKSQAELLEFTAGIGRALAASGTSASSASGAMLQLSQAIGGGIVRSEEFNSILEGTPRIAQAVADGLDKAGGSVSRLRTLVADGKVSSVEFFDAFTTQLPKIDAEFKQTESTISQSLNVLDNGFVSLIGRLDEATAASAGIASVIESVGHSFGWLADQMRRFGKDSELSLDELEQRANNFQSALQGMTLSGVGPGNEYFDSLVRRLREVESAIALIRDPPSAATAEPLGKLPAVAAAVNDNLQDLEAQLDRARRAFAALSDGGTDLYESTLKTLKVEEQAAKAAESFNSANKKAIESGQVRARTQADYLSILRQTAEVESKTNSVVELDKYIGGLHEAYGVSLDRLRLGEEEAAIQQELNRLRSAGIMLSEDQEQVIRKTLGATKELNDQWLAQQQAINDVTSASEVPAEHADTFNAMIEEAIR